MITKLGSAYFAHTTNRDSLEKMLDSGKILSLRHLATRSPESEISVEPYPILRIRETLPASEALERMMKYKSPDKIFLSRDFYNPSYGKYVVTKQLKHPKEHDRVTLIPNEFTTRRPLSLRHNASIWVPDEEVDHFRDSYKKYNIQPISGINLKTPTAKDSLLAAAYKIKRKLGLEKEAKDLEPQVKINKTFLRKNIAPKSMLVGSEALGTNLPGTSDIDIFIPYKKELTFNRAIHRLQEKYPGLEPTKGSANNPYKRVLTGNVYGKPMDLTVAYGPKAERFHAAFQQASQKLTPEEKQKIVQQKQRLKDAWVLPEWRYKRFKKSLDSKLGLKDAYF